MMSSSYVARSSTGTRHRNTIRAVPHPTFAVAEFYKTSDSNKMRDKWLGWAFRDVTPLWSKTAHCHTFSTAANVPKWPKFQDKLAGSHADWYYLSGHHGRQFTTDPIDPDVLDTQTEIGFFNEAYHRGRWAHRDWPATPAEVYMTMGHAPAGALGPDDNPLYAEARPKCKGVILMGCNTLIYRQVRIALSKAFPNAVLIGYMSKTPNDDSALEPVLKLCGRDFFLKPPSDDAPLEDLAKRFNVLFKPHGFMTLQRGSRLYCANHKRTATKSFPIDTDFLTIFDFIKNAP
jgi:hypothetical protein